MWSVCKVQAVKTLLIKCVQIDKAELKIFYIECTFYFTQLYTFED
jgi:hypothetical protein